MTPPDLKPCPFCGGKAILLRPEGGRPFVCCQTNFCTGPKATPEAAIAAWNARAGDTA